MSTDRTDAVIEAIDGALDDWSVSPDAMRWIPEPDDQARPTNGITWEPTPAPRHITIDWRPISPPRQNGRAARASSHGQVFFIPGFAASAVAAGEAFRRAAESVGRLFALNEADIVNLEEALRHLGSTDEQQEDERPESARARALRLRQQRGTGPERKPAGQMKRPRRG